MSIECINISVYISERPHSFGLHSPDQLPKSEIEFRKIANSFGLQSPTNNDTTVTPPDADGLHPSYNPRLFCDGGLYLDPDIIGKWNVLLYTIFFIRV